MIGKMSRDLTRRDLLRGTAATAAGLGLARFAGANEAPNSTKPKSPNDRIQFAVIGCTGKGWSDMEDAARHGDVVAICDVDVNARAKAMAQYPRASVFADFRVMLGALEDQIDAVTVSTPDHTHAPATAMALRLGMHAFTQKPLTRTLFEARRLAQLAREHRCATQMGNQGTAGSALRRAAAAIRAGTFGKVKEVHCWTDRCGGWWPQGVARPEAKVTPKTLEWDLWIGPSPYRPFADGYHPFSWRGWWDFGSGALGDMGCHVLNLPFMALDLRDPIAVTAETSGNNQESYPSWSIVKYEFGARKGRAPVALTWYDGGKRPPQEVAPGAEFGGNGIVFVCENATLFCPSEYGGDTKLLSGEPIPETPFEESPGHFEEWVNAINGGKPARSNFPDYAGPLTETVLLGNLAVWAGGKRVEWDSRRLRTKGTNEFDALIRPTYRKGWEL
jgi:predicted dehydrogenase